MVDKTKTMWTIILIFLAGVCWVLYQIYKRLFLPWRRQQVIASVSARMDRRDTDLANRRLSGYLSNHTSSDVLSSPETSQIDGAMDNGVSNWARDQDSIDSEEEPDRPPTYSYVTHNENEFLHDPPTYEEAMRHN